MAFAAGVWQGQQGPTQAGDIDAAAQAIYGVTLPDLQGKPQSVKQWRGKVLVVNFWATWCEPCRKEIPEFIKLQSKYQDKNLQFVGISIDQADKTSEFSRNFGINYPTLVGTFDTMEVSRQAGNQRRVLPHTVVLDKQGRVAFVELGGVSLETLEARLKPLL